MRKTLITLIATLTLMSCSMEEICGEVTGWSSSGDNYYLFVDGERVRVSFSDWLKADVGDYLCFN